MTDSLATTASTKVLLKDCCEEISQRIDNPAESGFERFVGLEHLETGETSIRNWGSTEDVTSSMKLFKAGDVIVARRNVYLRRAARAHFDGVCSGDGIVLRGKSGICLPDLLPFLLNTDAFWDYVTSQADGTMSKRITVKRLLSYEFSLPPLEEQRRIAEVLRAHHLLIESIAVAERKAKEVLTSYINTLSSNYPTESLGKLASKVTSGSRGWARYYSDEGPWFIRVTNLCRDSVRLDLDDLKFVQPPSGAEGVRTRVEPLDVLVAVTGVYLGMIALTPESIPEAYVNQHVAIVRFDRALVNPTFAAYMLKSATAQRQIWSNNDGTTKPGMNLTNLKNITIAYPNIEQQAKAADELQQLESSRQALAARRKNAVGFGKALLQTMMGGGS